MNHLINKNGKSVSAGECPYCSIAKNEHDVNCPYLLITEDFSTTDDKLLWTE